MGELAEKHGCDTPLYPCLDHGGPWLKDDQAKLGFAETMAEVKRSITACLQAGYTLLHADPTVDRGLSGDEPLDVRIVVGSSRWHKWLQPEEFHKLSAERQRWLVTSGGRYVWTQLQVVESRSRLYENLTPVMGDPHGWVVDRKAASIEKYVRAFKLFGSAEPLGATKRST
jgi:hypothetical protein